MWGIHEVQEPRRREANSNGAEIIHRAHLVSVLVRIWKSIRNEHLGAKRSRSQIDCGSPLACARSASAGNRVLLAQRSRTKQSESQPIPPPAITQGEHLCLDARGKPCAQACSRHTTSDEQPLLSEKTSYIQKTQTRVSRKRWCMFLGNVQGNHDKAIPDVV